MKIFPRSSELHSPSIKPSPIQRLQIYHAAATAASIDRGIAAPNHPPSHPIRAPMLTTRNLRIRKVILYKFIDIERNHCIYPYMYTYITAQMVDSGIGWRTNLPCHSFPARSVTRLPQRNIRAHQSVLGIQSIITHPYINSLRQLYFANKMVD